MKINYNIKPLQIITKENVKVGFILTCIKTAYMSGSNRKDKCFTKNRKYEIISLTNYLNHDIKVIDDGGDEHFFDIGNEEFTNKRFRI